MKRRLKVLMIGVVLLAGATAVGASCEDDYSATVSSCEATYGAGTAGYSWCAAGAWVDLQACRLARALILD